MTNLQQQQHVDHDSNQFLLARKACVVAGLVALAWLIRFSLEKYLHHHRNFDLQLDLNWDVWTLNTWRGAKNTLRFALSMTGTALGIGSAAFFAMEGPADGMQIWNMSVMPERRKTLPDVPYGVWLAWFGFVLKGTFTLFGVIDTVLQRLYYTGPKFSSVVRHFHDWRNGMTKTVFCESRNADKIEIKAAKGSVRFLARLLSSLGMLTLGGFFFDEFKFKFPWLGTCMLIRSAPNAIAHWEEVPRTSGKSWKEEPWSKTKYFWVFYVITNVITWAGFFFVFYQVYSLISTLTFSIYGFRLMLEMLLLYMFFTRLLSRGRSDLEDTPPSKLSIVEKFREKFDDILKSEFGMRKEYVSIFLRKSPNATDDLSDADFQPIGEALKERSNALRAKHLYVKIHGIEGFRPLNEWYGDMRMKGSAQSMDGNVGAPILTELTSEPLS